MPTLRDMLERELGDLVDYCTSLHDCVYAGLINAVTLGTVSDEELIEWLKNDRFECGGRVGKTVDRIRKSLDYLQKLLEKGDLTGSEKE